MTICNRICVWVNYLDQIQNNTDEHLLDSARDTKNKQTYTNITHTHPFVLLKTGSRTHIKARGNTSFPIQPPPLHPQQPHNSTLVPPDTQPAVTIATLHSAILAAQGLIMSLQHLAKDRDAHPQTCTQPHTFARSTRIQVSMHPYKHIWEHLYAHLHGHLCRNKHTNACMMKCGQLWEIFSLPLLMVHPGIWS